MTPRRHCLTTGALLLILGATVQCAGPAANRPLVAGGPWPPRCSVKAPRQCYARASQLLDQGQRAQAFLVAAFAVINGDTGAYWLVRMASPASTALQPDLRRACEGGDKEACKVLVPRGGKPPEPGKPGK